MRPEPRPPRAELADNGLLEAHPGAHLALKENRSHGRVLQSEIRLEHWTAQPAIGWPSLDSSAGARRRPLHAVVRRHLVLETGNP